MSTKTPKDPKEIYYNPEGSPVVPDRYDTRIRLRSVTKGLLSLADLEKYKKTLPDESANADFVSFDSIVSGEEDPYASDEDSDSSSGLN